VAYKIKNIKAKAPKTYPQNITKISIAGRLAILIGE
jgi:hypothetical protein